MGVKKILNKIIPSLYAKNAIIHEIQVLSAKIENISQKNEMLLSALNKLDNESDMDFKKRMFAALPKATGDLRLIQLCNDYILKEMKKVCDANNIHFFLDSGTLLGAVRHHGFIPWDDDIDVIMTSDDYDKFVEILKDHNELEVHKYYVGSHFVCIRKVKLKKCPYLFVDIFTIEPIGTKNVEDLDKFFVETQNQCEMFHNELKQKMLASKLLTTQNGGHESIPQLDDAVDELIARFRDELPNGNDAICAAIDNYPRVREQRNVLPYSVYYPAKQLYFEGVEYDVPHNCDAVLKQMYGDYWTFPNTVLPSHDNDLGSHINEIKMIYQKLQIIRDTK